MKRIIGWLGIILGIIFLIINHSNGDETMFPVIVIVVGIILLIIDNKARNM